MQSFPSPGPEPFLLPENAVVQDQRKALQENFCRAVSGNSGAEDLVCLSKHFSLVINVKIKCNKAEYMTTSSCKIKGEQRIV